MLDQPAFAIVRMEKVFDAKAAIEEKEVKQRESQQRLAAQVGDQ